MDKRTGAEGIRSQEGHFINKSLLALTNVIRRLSEGGRYCNNMLTQYMHAQGIFTLLTCRQDRS